MLLRRLPLDLVVHQCRHIVLKRVSELIDSCLVCATLEMAYKLIVGLEDLLIGVGQVILTAICA